MSLKEVTYYTIVCDECGKDFNAGSEFTAWSAEDGAFETFEDSYFDAGWSRSPDGTQHRCEEHNPFCERCGRDAGELSGERDYMCPACWDAEEVLTP